VVVMIVSVPVVEVPLLHPIRHAELSVDLPSNAVPEHVVPTIPMRINLSEDLGHSRIIEKRTLSYAMRTREDNSHALLSL